MVAPVSVSPVQKMDHPEYICKAMGVLGVSGSATEEEVKEAYRKLVKMWHPDINRAKEAHDKMIEINRAYETIMKGEFGKEDVWDDYDKWWFKQFGNDPIWGSAVNENA